MSRNKYDWFVSETPALVDPPEEFLEELQSRLDFVFSSVVTPTIKGGVTMGKLRWRGIKRVSSFVYGDYAYEFHIGDDGTFRYLQIGMPVRPHEEIVYPIIKQRKRNISLDFESDACTYAQYRLWKDTNDVIAFGTFAKKDGVNVHNGILNAIAKKRSKKAIVKQWIRRHFRWIITPIQNIQIKYYYYCNKMRKL